MTTVTETNLTVSGTFTASAFNPETISLTEASAAATAAAPTLSFTGDSETGLGLYRSGADTLKIAASGGDAVTIDGTGVSVVGTLTTGGVADFAAGSVGAPGIIVTGDTDTGLYQIASDNWGFASGGIEIMDMSASGLGVTGALSSSGTLTVGGVADFDVGSVLAPSITITSDPDTGFYYLGVDNWGFASGGSKTLDMKSTGLDVTGTLLCTGTLTAGGVADFDAGSVSAPGITVTGDTDTGLYQIAGDNWGFAAAGSKVLDMSASGLGVTGTLDVTGVADFALGTSGAAAISFGGDVDTGFYSTGAGNVSVTSGAAQVASFSSTGLTIPTGYDIQITDAPSSDTHAVNRAYANAYVAGTEFSLLANHSLLSVSDAGAFAALSIDSGTPTDLSRRKHLQYGGAIQGTVAWRERPFFQCTTLETQRQDGSSEADTTIYSHDFHGTRNASNYEWANAFTMTLGTVTPGNNYELSGSFTNVPLTGGSGTGATANITTSAEGGVETVTLVEAGSGYLTTDTLSAEDENLGGLGGSGFSVAINAVTGQVETFALTNGGNGYVEGAYDNVALTGGSGTGAVASIDVDASGAVEAVFIIKGGVGYAPGDALFASGTDLGNPAGSGFVITVSTVIGANALEAVVFSESAANGGNYDEDVPNATGNYIQLVSPTEHAGGATAAIKISQALSGARLKFEANISMDALGVSSASSGAHAVVFFHDDSEGTDAAVCAHQSFQFHRTAGTGKATHSISFVETLPVTADANDYWYFKIFLTKSQAGDNVGIVSNPLANSITITEL